MRALGRAARGIDEAWRGAFGGVLYGLVVGAFAIAVNYKYNRWAGIGVVIAGLVAWIAAAAWRHKRPPRDRHNQRAVLRAVYGPPSDDPISMRELCAAAIICAVHEGMNDEQIAHRLDCKRADVPMLLGIAPPDA